MFTNSAQRITPDDKRYNPDHTEYFFDAPSPYLVSWHRLFQMVTSQAGTKLVTDKFHRTRPGIYKSEGGINIEGLGDFVLGKRTCYWDGYGGKDRSLKDVQRRQLVVLISDIVLGWDPEHPTTSMLEHAAIAAKCDVHEFASAVSKMSINPFSGDMLSTFFDFNPFSGAIFDAEYHAWCKTHRDQLISDATGIGMQPQSKEV